MPNQASCIGCSLQTQGQGFCTNDGTGENGILLVGESLGEEEILANGKPFVGKAGEMLNRLISRTLDPLTRAPLERHKFKISNSVFCQPPNNELLGASYFNSALSHCKPNLDQVIAEMKPKVIVALGKIPLYRLTGLGLAKNSGIEYWRGSLLESPYGWVIPTFHPSYIMRGNFRYAQVFIRDLLRALELSRRGGVSTQALGNSYMLYPTPEVVRRFISDFTLVGKPTLAFDIETNYSGGEDEDALEEVHLEETESYQINRISFAFQAQGEKQVGPGELERSPHAVITMPWEEPFSSLARELLGSAHELCVWNAPFDVPRLMASGVNFNGAMIHDSMLAWHMYKPSLPYNLQMASSMIVEDYRAWKNTSSAQPEHYSAQDSDYLLRCHNFVKARLESEGRWETFQRHFTEVGRVLRRMTKRGVAVNPEKRSVVRAEFKQELANVVAQIQPHIPLALKPKKVYKLSREALLKKGHSLEAPLWTTVEVELAKLEIAKQELKSQREDLKAFLKVQKLKAKNEKALAHELAKSAKAADKLQKRMGKSLLSNPLADG